MKFFVISLSFIILFFNNIAHSVDDSDVYPKMVYWSALKKGNIKKVSEMLEKGMPPNISDASGMIPLAYAVASNKKELISMLVENKADINKTFKNKMTPLIYASIKNRYNLVSHLIKEGADINMQDHLGRTALMISIEKNHTYFVKEIIKFDFNKFITDHSGKTIYDYIEYSRNTAIINVIKNL